jgi:hypothetical protein
MDDIPKDKLAAFLDELTALSKKYGILIGGCGCCNSPYLQTPDGITYPGGRPFDFENFNYTYDKDQTSWTRQSYLEFMEQTR